jgi:hypothetical protein
VGEKSNSYMVLVGKPEGNRSLGRIKCRREDNIKMDLREIGWGSSDRGYGPVMSSCGDGNKRSGSIKCWGILE